MACPDDHASIGKRAFLPPPESSGPGLLLRAARPTGPRWISRRESPPPLFLDWPRRAVLHSRAPEPCRLRRDDHEVYPLLADPTRHHGRAAPPGATRYRLRRIHPCRGAASRRCDSPCRFDPDLLQLRIWQPSAAPSGPHPAPSPHLRDDPEPAGESTTHGLPPFRRIDMSPSALRGVPPALKRHPLTARRLSAHV